MKSKIVVTRVHMGIVVTTNLYWQVTDVATKIFIIIPILNQWDTVWKPPTHRLTGIAYTPRRRSR